MAASPVRFAPALVALLAFLPASATAQQAAPMPKLPDTAAGRCVAAWLEAIADPTPERVTAFETSYRSPKRLKEAGMEERIGRAKEVRDRLGVLKLREVLGEDAHGISVLADSERGAAVTLSFEFDPEQGNKLDGIQLAVGTAMTPRKLTAESRQKIVEAVASAVNDNYVYPETGAKMAGAIRGRLGSGEYDKIDTDIALTRRLTDDMRAISNDRHLGVRPQPRSPDREDGPGADEIAGDNYSFRRAEVLPGNIGYIRFDAFVQDPQAYKTAAAALAFVAHCDALIFDLRRNGGGDPDSIRFITSHLFDKPVHLNDMIDRDGKVVEEYWTLESVPGPRFAKDVPVFVLTSSYTFSGAEEFCYNLQNLKRGTVVGEKTGGGAHPVRGVRVDEHIVVGVPYMRACNPISKTNWEGTGIKPDVATAANDALERAVELARSAIAGRSSPPE